MNRRDICYVYGTLYINEGGWNMSTSYLVRRVSEGFMFETETSTVDILGRDPSGSLTIQGPFTTGEELYALLGIPEEEIPGRLAWIDLGLARGYLQAASAYPSFRVDEAEELLREEIAEMEDEARDLGEK